MGITPLIDAVNTGDRDAVERLLDAGADANEAGSEQGWTALNYAAGRGDLAIVRLLLDRGADPAKVGLDRRTAYLIALAAGRVDVARLLRDVEQQRQLAIDAHAARPYCRAYPIAALRDYPAWTEPTTPTPLTEEDVVFVHHDYRVTRWMWHDEHVVFEDGTQAWKTFCHNRLDFRIPDDVDLIVSTDTM